jgi:hypothetical protein
MIRNTQHAGRGGETAEIERLEPFGLDDPRGHHVVCAGRDQHAGFPQQLP